MKATDNCEFESGNSVVLREINTSDPCYEYLEQLMISVFPESERRDADEQRAVVDNDPRMHCCVIETVDDRRQIGMLNYWTLDGFVYIEHFATDPNLRGKGYGKDALSIFLNRNMPIVLEVEEPTDNITQRRIGFYQRNGLMLWPDVGYVQPPYRQGGESVPMRLMSTVDMDLSQLANVRDQLYKFVYKAI